MRSPVLAKRGGKVSVSCAVNLVKCNLKNPRGLAVGAAIGMPKEGRDRVSR